jgi:hypothetical protein
MHILNVADVYFLFFLTDGYKFYDFYWQNDGMLSEFVLVGVVRI